MLLDEIKARMFKAMKAGAIVEKEILRVAVGEITTDQAREGRKGNDEESLAILKKLVKSNEESLGVVEDPEKRAVLEEETRVLSAFLPKSLGVDEIVLALAPVADAIRAAGNDGQATGVAMKHLKSSGLSVGGKDVSEGVKRIRSRSGD
jgi:uncharacterized protein YqeY